jgi:nucleoside-diphosphate-sugar epimerase
MARAFIIGGTGVVGRAVAMRMLADGWEVDVVGRDTSNVPDTLLASGARFHAVQRHDESGLAAALGDGVDLLVDCVCYTAADAELLVPLAGRATSSVMISSKAVYVDRSGHHVNSAVAPQFDSPIDEAQQTMAPGHGDYMSASGYGSNKVAAENVLLESGHPITVVRASKVHGPGGARPREWVFVKRILDRRPVVFLARGGAGVDHTTAAANLAALVAVVAERPGARILNSADPDSPSGLEISRAIANVMDHEWSEVLLGEDAPEGLGAHPWDTVPAIVLDTSAALELGYRPVGDYATTVAESVEWLAARATPGDHGVELAGSDAEFFGEMFRYDAEDEYLASL